MGLPVIIGSAFVILSPKLLNSIDVCSEFKLNVDFIRPIYFILSFIVFYNFSIYILIGQSTRTFLYFSVITVLAAIIFIEIMLLDKEYAKIVLSQMLFVTLNLALGYTLKHNMVLFTDIFYHMHYINSILAKGIVTSEMSTYQYFPLFHIFNTLTILLLDSEIRTVYFVVNTLVFSLSLILVYLIIRQNTGSTSISLLTALMYSFSEPVIQGGAYPVTRTFAYIICLLILYLLLRRKDNTRLAALAVFLILPLTLLHQSTLAYFTFILILLTSIEYLFGDKPSIRGIYPLLFIISYTVYWVFICGPFFSSIIRTIFSTKETVSISPDSETSALITVFLNNADYFIIIVMAIIGVIALIYNAKVRMQGVTLAITALITLPFYIPSVSFLFTSMLGYRIPLLISPLVSFIVAVGFSTFIQKYRSQYICGHGLLKLGIVSLLILVFIFWSSCLSGKTMDFEMLPSILDKENKGYFAQSEMNSFFFCSKFGENHSTFFSDYSSYRFLDGYLNLTSSCSIDLLKSDLVKQKYYFIFRKGEFHSVGKLPFSFGDVYNQGFASSIITSLKYQDNSFPESSWAERLNIYNNGNVLIYKQIN